MFSKVGFTSLKTFLRAFLLIGFILPVLIYGYLQFFKPADTSKIISSGRRPTTRHEMKGFAFSGIINGKNVIEIKAERFSIQKKKLGFFRVGLLNEAIFENAMIHLYGSRHSSSHPAQPSGDLTFNNVFSKEAMPFISSNQIVNIVIQPVQVALHDETSVVARITASSAAIRIKQQDILFKGNVTVVSGSKTLTTDMLSLNPKTAVLSTNEPYILKPPEKQRKGAVLVTDVLLKTAG